MRRPSLKTRFSWLNVASVLVILVAIMLWVGFPVTTPSRAVDAPLPDGSEETTDLADLQCIQQVAEPLIEEEGDLISFLQDIYQAEDNNSQLLGEVTTEYDAFLERTNELLNEYATLKEGQTLDDALSQIAACEYFVAQHVTTVKAMMQDHNVRTGSAKVTYSLVLKLKDINEGLGELNETFAKIYGDFKTLSTKLVNTTD